MAESKKKKEFSYNIIKELMTISESPESDGWDKVVSVVSWNGGKPKIDIRSWNKDRSRMGKGVSLTADEFDYMLQTLSDEDFSKYIK